MMQATIKGYPLRHLMVVTANGTIDLENSKAAMKRLAADPDFDWSSEVLLDCRGIECELSTFDVFVLAISMAFPHPALPTYQRVALLVDKQSPGHFAFDHARFLQLCAENRGVNIRAFENYQSADAWLMAELPEDPRDLCVPPVQRKAT